MEAAQQRQYDARYLIFSQLYHLPLAAVKATTASVKLDVALVFISRSRAVGGWGKESKRFFVDSADAKRCEWKEVNQLSFPHSLSCRMLGNREWKTMTTTAKGRERKVSTIQFDSIESLCWYSAVIDIIFFLNNSLTHAEIKWCGCALNIKIDLGCVLQARNAKYSLLHKHTHSEGGGYDVVISSNVQIRSKKRGELCSLYEKLARVDNALRRSVWRCSLWRLSVGSCRNFLAPFLPYSSS